MVSRTKGNQHEPPKMASPQASSVRRRQRPAPSRVCSELLLLPKSRLVLILVKPPQTTSEFKESGASLPVDANRNRTQHRPPRTDLVLRDLTQEPADLLPHVVARLGQTHEEGDVLVSRQSSVLGSSNKLCEDVKVLGRAAIFVADNRHSRNPSVAESVAGTERRLPAGGVLERFRAVLRAARRAPFGPNPDPRVSTRRRGPQGRVGAARVTLNVGQPSAMSSCSRPASHPRVDVPGWSTRSPARPVPECAVTRRSTATTCAAAVNIGRRSPSERAVASERSPRGEPPSTAEEPLAAEGDGTAQHARSGAP